MPFVIFINTPLTLSLQYNLEFELKLQQYIEMVRTDDRPRKIEAISYAKKFLVPSFDSQNEEVMRAAGLLVFTQRTRAEPYKVACTRKLTQESID